MSKSIFQSVLEIIQNFINDDEQKFKYILKEGAFTRESEMPFKDHIQYMLNNKGLSSVIELDKYFEEVKGMEKLPISKQAFSQQRQNIDPEYFKEMNKAIMKSQYELNKDRFSKFKGKYVFAIDGSEVGIPNTPETRKEFEVKSRALKRKQTPKARISITSDALNGYIIDTQIEPTHIGESKLAEKNIEELEKTIPLDESIIIFDRYYASVKLILQLLDKNTDFIFRLKSSTFKKQREMMKTDDEYITIKLKKKYLRTIKNKDLIKKAKEIKELKLRVVNIPLETGEIETLLTSLPPETANPRDLKKLYGERWNIEKNYDVMKNKLEIENFSGKKRITIEQDFYSTIVAFNIINEEKLCQTYKLHKNKGKTDPQLLKINNNLLIGKIKQYLLKMILAETKEEQDWISERITFTIQREYIKTPKEIDKTRTKEKNNNKYKITQKRNH